MKDELKQELADLESEELNDRLMGADRAPIHSPAGTSKVVPESEHTDCISWSVLMSIQHEKQWTKKRHSSKSYKPH